MEVTEKSVKHYLTPDGRSPFYEWFKGLRDKRGKGAVLARIARLRLGNLGDWKSVGEGVCELRIHFGAGLRVYFAEDSENLVLLICGGDKSSQEKNIQKAKEYWNDYQETESSKEL